MDRSEEREIDGLLEDEVSLQPAVGEVDDVAALQLRQVVAKHIISREKVEVQNVGDFFVLDETLSSAVAGVVGKRGC